MVGTLIFFQTAPPTTASRSWENRWNPGVRSGLKVMYGAVSLKRDTFLNFIDRFFFSSFLRKSIELGSPPSRRALLLVVSVQGYYCRGLRSKWVASKSFRSRCVITLDCCRTSGGSYILMSRTKFRNTTRELTAVKWIMITVWYLRPRIIMVVV